MFWVQNMDAIGRLSMRGHHVWATYSDQEVILTCDCSIPTGCRHQTFVERVLLDSKPLFGSPSLAPSVIRLLGPDKTFAFYSVMDGRRRETVVSQNGVLTCQAHSRLQLSPQGACGF